MSEASADLVTVDASLAVKWVLEEDYTEEADALLEEWTTRPNTLIAPSWFSCEIANALHRRVHRGLLPFSAARLAFRDVLSKILLVDPDPNLAERAMELASLLGRPSTYDCQYAALTEREGCELWTADERFWNAARAQFPWIRWIGERTASR